MSDSKRPSTEKTAPEAPSASPSSNLSLDDLRELFTLMKSHEIADLNWEQGGMRIQVTTTAAKRAEAAAAASNYLPVLQPAPVVVGQPSAAGAAPATPPPAAAAAAEATAEAKPAEATGKTVNSPMVGTFYRSPSPDASAFVEVGDRVKEGDVLCIVEAMKLMNEIKSEVRGKITKVLVQNGMPVQYGQPLFVIDPE